MSAPTVPEAPQGADGPEIGGEAPATADNQEQLVSWIVGARGSTTI